MESTTSTAGAALKKLPGDYQYQLDESKLDGVRKAKAWMQDAKYFKRVSISPSAVMTMMLHAQSGVNKGTSTSGKPIEVMGLLLGRPDTEDDRNIVITDAQPLPIEGFETKVIADDQNVINYMINLSESLALTRKERFCGWYHTHPFDVGAHSNCFLSNTDISTQLMWQLSEDAHGNPWVALVIDPLRSLVKGRPEIMAFRAYPPDVSATADETPDGKIVRDEKTRLELWGACWNRYYALEVKYFMSELASTTLSILRNNTMWKDTFVSSAVIAEERIIDETERLGTAIESLQRQEPSVMSLSKMSGTNGEGSSDLSRRNHLSKAGEVEIDLAADKCLNCLSELTKMQLFADKTVATGTAGVKSVPGVDMEVI